MQPLRVRRARFARLVSLALSCVVVAFFLIAGCGRSSLESETTSDAGDGGGGVVCTPETCPTGCCAEDGVCRVGNDARACGLGGGRCNDCVANGFEFCALSRVCGRSLDRCDAQSCPNGCCSFANGMAQCLFGNGPGACGTGGERCVDCASQGRTCDLIGRECSAERCDPSTCTGCCVGAQCLPGGLNTACGTAGEACANCTSQGGFCSRAVDAGSGGSCSGITICGPSNCAGCCLGNTCVVGSDGTACGAGGAACQDCAATGRTCGAGRTCETPPTCNAQTCPGCCVGNACVIATTPAACGRGGEACRACGGNEACNAGVCTPAPPCGPANCAGCCVGTDVCAVGSQNTACGATGAQCTNCTAQGRVCQGGACQVPTCGPANCAGCCSGNTCVLGTQDSACGTAGAACADCSAAGNQICQGSVCRERCGPANCAGCCTTGNTCQLGFTNGACGSGGAACSNCTASATTCNTLVTPRVCTGTGGNCPVAYPGCPGATALTPLTPTEVCADHQLDDLGAACTAGPSSASCLAALAVLNATNAACRTCVTPLLSSFADLSGLYACAAASVTPGCRGSMGCVEHCTDTTCAQCAAGSQAQCRNQVRAGTPCGTFVQAVTTCAQPALQNGALCSPQTYGNNYGAWLRAVGDHYCGDGAP